MIIARFSADGSTEKRAINCCTIHTRNAVLRVKLSEQNCKEEGEGKPLTRTAST